MSPLRIVGSLVCLLWGVAAAMAQPPVERFVSDSRNWSRNSEARVITDLSQATPATALTTGRREKGKWKVISYEAEGLRGNLLSTFKDTGAANVQVPLNTEGWHAVYVGMCTVSMGLDKPDPSGVRVRLSGEPFFQRMANNLPILKPRRDQIQEVFLTVADLRGRSLEIAPLPFKPATVSYVKLVPLTEAEVASQKTLLEGKASRDEGTRPVIATFDGHSWIWPYRPRTADDLRETFRGFERTDVTKWWFQVTGADLVCYPSQVGNIPGDGTEDFMRWEYKEYTDNLKALFAAKVNPLQVAREEARKQGTEFHVMIRPAGWKGAYPWDEIFNSHFFEQHPEWRCIDRDGTPTLFMSYAYPEVRQQVLKILAETLELQPEGVGFLFHRGMPMLLWEEPFCREFQEKYGDDARKVPEDDPRILDLRAELMTRLLREVRTLLDETAKKQGRTTPYKISLATFSTEKDNRKFGFDVPRWIKEKLVDDLGIAWFAHHTSFVQPDVAYYKKITAGSNVGVYPFVIAWTNDKPQQLCARVTQFYKAGATGIAVWDPATEAGWRDPAGTALDVLGRLGHVSDVQRWGEKGIPQPLSIPLTRFGDNHYSRWFPNTGY